MKLPLQQEVEGKGLRSHLCTCIEHKCIDETLLKRVIQGFVLHYICHLLEGSIVARDNSK